MEKVKVSACIITYNQQAYIGECLDGAVKQQVNFDYEIVIGEDHSTDDTLKICREYAQKYPNLIRLIPRESNLGMAQNWVNTIQNCTGKYIAICEGDDYWTDPFKLQQQVDFLESHPDCVLTFHAVEIRNNQNKIVNDFLTSVPENYQTITTLAQLGNYIHTPSVVFRNVIKTFPYEFTQSPIVDFFLYLMLAEHGKLQFLPQKMAVYRYGVGIFSNQSMVKTVKASTRLFSCLLGYVQEENIRKILLERQMKTIDVFENAVKNAAKSGSAQNHSFFRSLKYVFSNLGQPAKIVKKIKSKF